MEKEAFLGDCPSSRMCKCPIKTEYFAFPNLLWEDVTQEQVSQSLHYADMKPKVWGGVTSPSPCTKFQSWDLKSSNSTSHVLSSTSALSHLLSPASCQQNGLWLWLVHPTLWHLSPTPPRLSHTRLVTSLRALGCYQTRPPLVDTRHCLWGTPLA